MSRSRARSRVARLAPRLLFAAIAAASILSGILAGCGIDFEGGLVPEAGLDATENVGANLPETGTDGSTDGPVTDAVLDADAAPAVKCTDTRCIDAGGVCNPLDETCTFHCDGGTNCDAGLTCPPGVACHVICGADKICSGQIDCTQASSCNIECLGDKTCDSVACSGSSCRVQCSGFDSCGGAGSVTCDASKCDIGCVAEGGANNCKELVTCESAVACSVHCNAGGCVGGVLAVTPDASIQCGDMACKGGETCRAEFCDLGCKGGPCATNLCCEAGVCIVVPDGGNKCK